MKLDERPTEAVCLQIPTDKFHYNKKLVLSFPSVELSKPYLANLTYAGEENIEHDLQGKTLDNLLSCKMCRLS